YAHHSPQWVHHSSLIVMFVIEIGLAFLILGPRWLRIWAFWPMVLLQIAIAATGNYCFFNFLTALLCLWILDDQHFKRFGFRPPPKLIPEISLLKRVMFETRGWALAVLTVIILIFSFIHLSFLAERRPSLPKTFAAIYSW